MIQLGVKRTAQKRSATSVEVVVAVTAKRVTISAVQSPSASSRRSSAPRRREPSGPLSPSRSAAVMEMVERLSPARRAVLGGDLLGVGGLRHPQAFKPF